MNEWMDRWIEWTDRQNFTESNLNLRTDGPN